MQSTHSTCRHCSLVSPRTATQLALLVEFFLLALFLRLALLRELLQALLWLLVRFFVASMLRAQRVACT